MPQEAASHHLRRTPLESSQSNIWKVVFFCYLDGSLLHALCAAC